MKIGDEILIHGYIDEIRKDVVIIRNAGGYFGTIEDEIVKEPKTDYKAFAEWVASEIFSEDWEFNEDSFAEIACRKLSKWGIVASDGDAWKLKEGEASE